MWAFRVIVNWAATLLPTWLYAPLWFMIEHTFWPGFGIGFLTAIYLFIQAALLLFSHQSKYI